MAGRRDDGYEVRSRITTRPDRASRAVFAVIGLIAIGGLASTLLSGPLETALETALATASPAPPAVATPAGPPTPRPSRPALELFPGAPTTPIPMNLSSTAWVTMTDADVRYAPVPNTIALSLLLGDGSVLCACYAVGFGGERGALHLVRTFADPAATKDVDLGDWVAEDFGTAGTALTILPGRDLIVLAAVEHDPEHWIVRIELRTMDGTLVDTLRVGSETRRPATGYPGGLRVWAAPDGNRFRLRLLTGFSSGLAQVSNPPRLRWDVGVAGDRLVDPVRIEGDGPAPTDACPVQGWATPTQFVEVCGTSTLGELVAWTTPALGAADRIVVDTRADLFATDWLIDASVGVVYGWSAATRTAYRIGVPGLAVVMRSLPLPDPSGFVQAERARPPEHVQPAIWFAGGEGFRHGQMLVGSPDGSVLLGAGLDSAGSPVGRATPSAGIYLLDADNLALVDHWAPTATYEAMGLTADGQFVLGLGPPLPEEVTTYGDTDRELVVQATPEGELVAVVRDLAYTLGGVPGFYEVGPAP